MLWDIMYVIVTTIDGQGPQEFCENSKQVEREIWRLEWTPKSSLALKWKIQKKNKWLSLEFPFACLHVNDRETCHMASMRRKKSILWFETLCGQFNGKESFCIITIGTLKYNAHKTNLQILIGAEI